MLPGTDTPELLRHATLNLLCQRQLWKALIELDEVQLRRSAEALGAGKYYQFFPLMFTYQRWGGSSKLGQQMSPADLKKLKVRDTPDPNTQHAHESPSVHELRARDRGLTLSSCPPARPSALGCPPAAPHPPPPPLSSLSLPRSSSQKELSTVTLPDLLDFLESAPRDLLLVMRTTNLLRSINRDLGGTAFERFAIMANTAVRGIYEKDAGETRSWSDWAGYTVSATSVRWRLWWIQAAASAVMWWRGGNVATVAQEAASAVADADGLSEHDRRMVEQAMSG